MGLFSKQVTPHEWSKKEIDLGALRQVLETGQAAGPYADSSLIKIASKCRKDGEPHGVSNLYLLLEGADSDGDDYFAYYCFSITEGTIDEDLLAQIRNGVTENMDVSEMYFFSAPGTLTAILNDRALQRFQKGTPESFHDLLTGQFHDAGIRFVAYQTKPKKRDELECSAIFWADIRRGMKTYIVHNNML